MPSVILCTVVLVVLTTVIHYEVLRLLSFSLPVLRVASRTKLMVVIFAAFLSHAVQVLFYGLAFYILVHRWNGGTLGGIGQAPLDLCIYFSAETYSSLGYGDIIPGGAVRLLASAETLNGLLLIGWSASYTYLAMERFWNTKN